MSRPIVVIPADTKVIEGLTFDAVGRKYSTAVAEVAECQPLLVPLDTALVDIGAVLDIADAILLSGSVSNVHPSLYGTEAPLRPETMDPARDSFTLPLIRTAVEKKIPLFAICRGYQELNVALGGSLHQAVHDQPGLNDHRENPALTMGDRFGPSHPIRLEGELRGWIGEDNIIVNSLHGQGIARLAERLRPQAYAEDGLVEAVLGPEDHPFLLGVQWHPEWHAKNNQVSTKLFRRFGDAARTNANGQST